MAPPPPLTPLNRYTGFDGTDDEVEALTAAVDGGQSVLSIHPFHVQLSTSLASAARISPTWQAQYTQLVVNICIYIYSEYIYIYTFLLLILACLSQFFCVPTCVALRAFIYLFISRVHLTK